MDRWKERARRSLIVLVRVALVLLALLWMADRPGARRFAADRIAQAASLALGDDVVLGDLFLRVRGEPALVLRGVAVAHEGRPVLALPEVVLVPGWGRLRRIQLESPSINLHFVDGVLQEFPGLREEADAESAPPDELPWDELVIHDATLRLEAGAAGEEPLKVELEGFNLEPEGVSERSTLSLRRLALRRGSFEQVSEAMEIRGAELGATHLHLPDIALSFPALRLEGEVVADLGGALGGHLEAVADLGPLSELMPAGTRLEGPLAVDLDLGGTLAAPAMEGAISGDVRLLQYWSDGTKSRYNFGEITGLFTADPEGVSLRRIVTRVAEGRVALSGRIAADGKVERLDVGLEDLSFHKAMDDFGEVDDSWVEFRADGELNLEGTLSPFQLEGPLDLAISRFLVADDDASRRSAEAVLRIRGIQLQGGIQFFEDGARITADRLSSGDSQASVEAWLPFSPNELVDIDIRQSDLDLALFAPLGDAELGGRAYLQGELFGTYDNLVADATASVDGLSCVGVRWADQFTTRIHTDDFVTVSLREFTATLVDPEAPAGPDGERQTSVYKGDLDLIFADVTGLEAWVLIPDARVQDIARPWIEIPGLEGEVDGTLSLSGPIDALEGDVYLDFSGVTWLGETFDEGRAEAFMRQGRFTLRSLSLSREGGRESVFARGSVGAGWAMDMEVLSDGLRLQTLDNLSPRAAPGAAREVPSGVSGDLSLAMQLGGTLFAPEPEGRAALRNAVRLGQDIPDLDLRFSTDAGLLEVEGGGPGLALTALVGLEDGEWSGSLSADDLRLDALWPRAADGRPVAIRATGTASGQGDLDRASIVADLESLSLAWNGLSLSARAPFEAGVEGERAWVQGLVLSPGARAKGPGLAVDVHTASGTLELAAIGGVDAAWLPALTDIFDRAAGNAVLDLRLAGPIAEPGGTVRLDLQDAELRSPYFPHPMERVRATVTGGPDGYDVAGVAGELGGGTFDIRGRVEAARWVPTRWALDGYVKGTRVRLYDEIPAMVVSGPLRLEGPVDALLLSGDLVIDEMIFAERIDWEQWTVDWRQSRLAGALPDAVLPEPTFALDVRIVAEGTVEVRNNIGQGILDADLRLVGDDTNVGMVGDVRMQPGGTLVLQGREFDVTRAEARYVDPFAYDPELDFLLGTEVRSGERVYRITYPVTGLFSDWRADPRSDPPLSAGDINSLLLFGLTLDELERSGAAGAALAAEGLDLLVTGEGTRALDRFTGERTGELLSYARVDLVTGVSQRNSTLESSEWRLLVEKDLPEPVEGTVVGELGVDTQYLAFERQIASNLYFDVFWSSEQQGRTLPIGGAYGADIKARWESD